MKNFQLRIFFKTMVVFCLLYCALSIAAYGEIIFQEDFENGWGIWHADNGVWDIGVPTKGPSNAHSLSKCTGTILGGNYPQNTDSRLISPTVVLPAIDEDEEIVLSFWHYYRYYPSSSSRYSDDQGKLQISYFDKNTKSWSGWIDIRRCAKYESPVWSFYQRGLNEYSDTPIKIGFLHIIEDYSGTKHTHYGWYVDDIKIEKKQKELFTGIETFEDGWGRWSAGSGLWEVGQSKITPNSSGNDDSYIGTVLNGNYPEYSYSCLYSPEIQVPFVESYEEVNLTYRHYFVFDTKDDSYGKIWFKYLDDNIWSDSQLVDTIYWDSGGWTQGLISLTQYSGKTVQAVFCLYADEGSAKGWYIDEVRMTPPPKPYLPFSPAPNDPQLENEPITITPTLSWDCLDPSVSENAKFHVYLGKDDPSNLVSIAQNLTQTAYQPEQLTYNTIYSEHLTRVNLCRYCFKNHT